LFAFNLSSQKCKKEQSRPRDTAVQGGDVASDEKERRKKRGRKNIQYPILNIQYKRKRNKKYRTRNKE
jgi:hypothetical protein